jgi:hypothetical protein
MLEAHSASISSILIVPKKPMKVMLCLKEDYGKNF